METTKPHTKKPVNDTVSHRLENAESYPEKIRNILYKDIFQRPENDPVRVAYELAAELHRGQKRKGINEPDYITHPLQVYDMVKRCMGKDKVLDKDIMLAAALLHDTVEDYGKKDHTKMPEMHRIDVIEKIEKAYAYLSPNNDGDSEFTRRLFSMLKDLSLPIKKMDDEEKRSYQIEAAKNAPPPVRLIKICNQTLNIVSNVEEVPRWDYKKVMEYTGKTRDVVRSAYKSTLEKDPTLSRGPYYKAIRIATEVYTNVSEAAVAETKRIKKRVDHRELRGEISEETFPPNAPFGSFSLSTLIDGARYKIEHQERTR